MQGERKILIVAMSVLLMCVGIPAVSSAVDVFGECAYTDADVECYIYTNAGVDELRSGGVKLLYNDTCLSSPVATKNTTDWYFGDPTTTTYDYMNPEILPAGEVTFIVGKLDSRITPVDHTGEGVSGQRILIGSVKFVRSAGSDITTFGLDLVLGRDDGPDGYVNFVNTTGADLDNDVTFNTILAERGDANLLDGITVADMFKIRSLIGGSYSVFADCNGIDGVTVADMFCVRSKLQ